LRDEREQQGELPEDAIFVDLERLWDDVVGGAE